jgi:hypothetical protein
MTDEAREPASPLVALAALAPDAAFAAARMFQRAAFAAVNRGARVTGAIAGAVASTPPVRGSLSFLESQLEPLAARGVEQRHEDEEQIRTFVTALTPMISAVLDVVVELLPIEAILARVDVDALVGRVDVDALIQRVDVNAIVGRVDVNDIVQRVDLANIVTTVLENIELGDLISDSTTNIATSARDNARVQAIRVDGGLAAVVDRLLRRRRDRDLVVAGYPLADV